MSNLRQFFDRAAEVYVPHSEINVRFVEIDSVMPDEIIGQLVGKDAVHHYGAESENDLRGLRLGGSNADKRCFAMMDKSGILHSAIYAHVGNKPIQKYTDLAGDVMPILTNAPRMFEGSVESFHCYSISAKLNENTPRKMGEVLIGNLHHFLTTNYPKAVISTLSPMRGFDKIILNMGYTKDTWARENDAYRRLLIMDYFMKCQDRTQLFHMGNGAIIGTIRLSTPLGAGDSMGMNRCMPNYIYNRNPEVLKQNAAMFKEICKNGGSIIEAGLVAPELVQQAYGAAETYNAALIMR